MRAEALIFAICTVFLVLITPAYWFITSAGDTGGDWTGTSALTMTTLLTLMVTFYLGFHAKKMEPRPEDRKDAEIASVFKRLEMAKEVAELGDPVELEARLASNPDDHEARIQFAKILNAKGHRDAAADELFTIMRKDPKWEDEAARKILLEFFEAWGPVDPATLSARRKLSSLLFS